MSEHVRVDARTCGSPVQGEIELESDSLGKSNFYLLTLIHAYFDLTTFLSTTKPKVTKPNHA